MDKPDRIAAIRAEFERRNGPEPLATVDTIHQRLHWQERYNGFLLAHTSSEMAKDAERGRLFVERGGWSRHMDEDRPKESFAYILIRMPYDTDLSCVATRQNAIDAAITQAIGDKT